MKNTVTGTIQCSCLDRYWGIAVAFLSGVQILTQQIALTLQRPLSGPRIPRSLWSTLWEQPSLLLQDISLSLSHTSLGPSCKGFLAISWTLRACFCLRASTFAIFSAGDAPTCGLSSWFLLHFRFLFKWQFLPRCFSWFSYPQAAPSSPTEPQEVLLASYPAQVLHTTQHDLEFHHARTCLLIVCLPN